MDYKRLENYSLRSPRGQFLVLTAFILVHAAAKAYLLLKTVPAPVVFFDEPIYKDGAYSLFMGQGYRYRFGAPITLYPPLYSLFLAPAFLFGSCFYQAMLSINCLLTSLTMLPAWALIPEGKGALMQRVALVIMLALMPFHFYNSYLTAENLALPLLASNLWLLFHPPVHGKRRALILGALFAACALTKYACLPLLPLFVAFFWFQEFRAERSAIKAVWNLCSFVTAATLPLVCWAIYVLYTKDHPAPGVILVSKPVTLHQLLLWISYYASYNLLALAVLLPLLIFSRAPATRARALLLFLALGDLLLLVVSAKHSAGAAYNAARPLYLVGRYLSLLFPFFAIPASELLREVAPSSSRRVYWAGAAAITAVLTGAGYLCLTSSGNLIQGVNGLFAHQFSGAPSENKYWFVALLIYILLASWLASGSSVRRRYAAWATALICLIGVAIPHAEETLLKRQADRVVQLVAGEFPLHDKGLSILVDSAVTQLGIDSGEVLKKAAFFAPHAPIIRGALSDTRAQRSFLTYPGPGPGLMLSLLDSVNALQSLDQDALLLTARFCGAETKSVIVAGRQVRLYRLGEQTASAGVSRCSKALLLQHEGPLEVLDYGPRQIGGAVFNEQPDGRSAFWFKTNSSTDSVTVFLNDVPLETQAGAEGLVSASVPPGLVPSGTVFNMQLKDTITGRESRLIRILAE